MNIRMFRFFALLLLSCGLTSPLVFAAAASGRITEKKIEALLASSEEAFTRGDFLELGSHFADEYVITEAQEGPKAPKPKSTKRNRYLSLLETAFSNVENYQTSNEGVKIAISPDGKSANVSLTQNESWAKGKKAIRTISHVEHKVELHDEDVMFTSTVTTLLNKEESERVTKFSNTDFAAYAGDGPATLEGEAFLRLESGSVKNCAGEVVLLAPATDYDLNVIKAFTFGRNLALKQAGPAAKYWRQTQCDSQGKFSFENIPTGTWIVITDTSFDTIDPDRALGAMTSGKGMTAGPASIRAQATVKQGGLMARRVAVTGTRTKVILDQRNLRSSSLFKSDWLK